MPGPHASACVTELVLNINTENNGSTGDVKLQMQNPSESASQNRHAQLCAARRIQVPVPVVWARCKNADRQDDLGRINTVTTLSEFGQIESMVPAPATGTVQAVVPGSAVRPSVCAGRPMHLDFLHFNRY